MPSRNEVLFSQIAVVSFWFLSETNPDLLQNESIVQSSSASVCKIANWMF